MKFLTLLMLGVLIGQIVNGETLEQRAAREVLVKFRTTPARLDATEFPFSDKVVSVKQALPNATRTGDLCKIVSLSAESVRDALRILNELQADPRVEWAELRQMRYIDSRLSRDERVDPLDAPPNDPFYSQQWYLDQIEAPVAWDVVTPDSTIVMAVVDNGVNFDLPELQAARWNNVVEVNGTNGFDDDGNGYIDDLFGYDFMEYDGDPSPNPLDGDNSHGTHVSGIAAAARNNRIGIAGVAGGAKVMGVRVGQAGSIPYGFEGVYYACVSGAKVINCSWGGATESAYEREVVNYVRSQGCVVVCSAGNNGNSIPRYPAAIEGVLSVAATSEDNTAASFTNYGPWVKISAPGVYILSTLADGTYGAWQGTSMAAPIVTTVCGLMFKKYPDWSRDQVVTAICNSADPIDSVNDTLAGGLGLGRVNAYRAISNVEVSQGVRLSGLRFHETVGDGDNRIEAGEQAFLDVEIANEHGELLGVIGYVYSQLDSITVTPTELTYPAIIGNWSWWSDFTDPRIRMPEVIDRGAILPLRLEWRDATNQVVGRATTAVFLDTTFATIETSALKIALGEQGALGYFDYVRNIPVGPGLALKNHLSNALYHGSIFVGVDGKVIDNFYGDSTGSRFDWTALSDVYAQHVESSIAPIAVNSRFDDSRLNEAERIHAEVSATILSWPEIENGFALELKTINRGEGDWQDCYCGLMMDWDLGPSSRNFGAYDETSGILYVRSELPSLPLVGIAGLDEALSTAYEIGNRDEFQTGGLTDARAWQLVTAGIGGFTSTPRDLSHAASLQLPSLASADSVTRRFAIVTGNSLTELRSVLNHLCDAMGIEHKQPPDEPRDVTIVKPTVTPNPLAKGQKLAVSGIMAGSVSLTVYNILGQEIARLHSEALAAGKLEFAELPSMAPGLLLYRLEHTGGISTGKLLYLP
ncbi:MAG: S8 family serine peptidase [bacterium]|nr:S8 family serine peptidase [bacterium]